MWGANRSGPLSWWSPCYGGQGTVPDHGCHRRTCEQRPHFTISHADNADLPTPEHALPDLFSTVRHSSRSRSKNVFEIGGAHSHTHPSRSNIKEGNGLGS